MSLYVEGSRIPFGNNPYITEYPFIFYRVEYNNIPGSAEYSRNILVCLRNCTLYKTSYSPGALWNIIIYHAIIQIEIVYCTSIKVVFVHRASSYWLSAHIPYGGYKELLDDTMPPCILYKHEENLILQGNIFTTAAQM